MSFPGKNYPARTQINQVEKKKEKIPPERERGREGERIKYSKNPGAAEGGEWERGRLFLSPYKISRNPE